MVSGMRFRWALGLGLMAIAGTTLAQQPTPVGTWHTVNEETGKVQSTVRITETDGVLTGRIIALPDSADPNAVCNECRDQRKGARIVGLTIIEGVSNPDGDEYWDGGSILDPKNGKTYTVRLSPQDNGRRLQVRGYLGPFFRTQTWQRVE